MSGSTSVAERSKTLKETTITRGHETDSDGRGLKFLSLEGLYKALIKDKRNNNYPQFSDHYFTGDYPVKLIDDLGDNKVTQLSLLSTKSNN